MQDRERQKSKFGRVKPLWQIESKEDMQAKYDEEDRKQGVQDARSECDGRNKRGGEDD